MIEGINVTWQHLVPGSIGNTENVVCVCTLQQIGKLFRCLVYFQGGLLQVWWPCPYSLVITP